MSWATSPPSAKSCILMSLLIGDENDCFETAYTITLCSRQNFTAQEEVSSDTTLLYQAILTKKGVFLMSLVWTVG